MSIYRVKIARCLDIVVKTTCSDLIRIVEELSRICGIDSKIYIHRLRETGEGYESGEPLCVLSVREALHGRLQQCCQP